MSGKISRKMKHKTMRQQSKDEIRWYTKFFAEELNNEPDSISEYALLTSDDIHRLTRGVSIHRK